MRKQETESVVTVLGELRELDAQRVAEQRAAEERIRAARAAADRARAEEQAQRERAERARAEKRRLDVEIAERRAAIEAQMKIEERRIAVETEVAALRERQTRPARHWVTVALLALVVAGQAVLLHSQFERERELYDLIEQFETEARARPATVPGLPDELRPDSRVEPGVLAPDLGVEPAPASAAGSDEPPGAAVAEPPRTRREPRSNRQPRSPRHPKSRPAVADDCDPNDPLGCLPASQSNH